MPLIGLSPALPWARVSGDGTPGGSNHVLLLANGTDGLLLVDGTSFLKLASSS